MTDATPGYGDFDANRLRHLEMIQSVISRLAGNSFLIKGWAITLAAAFFGFAISVGSAWLPAAGFVPILAFWAIDTTYLKNERLFRALFEQVRLGDDTVAPFSMAATGDAFVGRLQSGATAAAPETASWWGTAKRDTLLYFYGALVIANMSGDGYGRRRRPRRSKPFAGCRSSTRSTSRS